MDTVVKYSLYNVGDAAAVEIQLTESGFSTDDFDIAGGNLAVQLDRMAPKANNSFTVIIQKKTDKNNWDQSIRKNTIVGFIFVKAKIVDSPK